jgi:hypothetical protein
MMCKAEKININNINYEIINILHTLIIKNDNYNISIINKINEFVDIYIKKNIHLLNTILIKPINYELIIKLLIEDTYCFNVLHRLIEINLSLGINILDVELINKLINSKKKTNFM